MIKQIIKNIFFAGTIFALFLTSVIPAQAEIPQKVTVQKVNIYGNTGDFDGEGEVEIKNGKIRGNGWQWGDSKGNKRRTVREKHL